MADNYLESRYAELFSGGQKVVKKIGGPSLDSLLVKNRSYRGFVKEHVVRREELEKMVAVCSRVPSARNQQVLRFRLVTKGADSERLLPLLRFARNLENGALPLPGTEPEAFIVICSTVEESRYVDIDLGIAAQSILLKAVEMGLGGICLGAFDKTTVREALHLPLDPLLILAIGKPSEKVQLLQIPSDKAENPDAKMYYRKDGIHYVPKLSPDEMII